MIENYYQPAFIAHMLSMDRGTVYRLIRQRKLRSVRINRLIRVSESALQEFLAANDSGLKAVENHS